MRKFFLALFLASYLSCNIPNHPGNSVVKLLNPTGGGGTGFEIETSHERQYTLTNAHMCLSGAVWAQIGPRSIPLRVIEISETTDLCLLEGIAGMPALRLGHAPEVGSEVHVYGFGFLLPLTHSQGEFVGRVGYPLLGVSDPVYTTAVILPGNSGSPVVDANGRLIGVVYASGAILADRALVVPLEDVVSFLMPY